MAIYNGWPNRLTHECYDGLDLKGDIQNNYLDLVVNHGYSVYQLAMTIREDVDNKIFEVVQRVDDELIANLLTALPYYIDYVEIATSIYLEAQYITNDSISLNQALEQELNLKGDK